MRPRASAGQIRRVSPTRANTTLIWAVVLALAGMLLVPLGKIGGAAIDRAAAQTAADAAALAGAFEGRSEAAALARANGARLEQFVDDGVAVTVVVRVRGSRASARAERIFGAAPDTVRTPRRRVTGPG